MMPQAGRYCCENFTAEEFKEIFNQLKKKWASYIGYPNTARILTDLLGVEVPISQAETVLGDGDVCLCVRLNRRVADKTQKAGGQLGQKIEDYQFFVVTYEEL